MRNLIGTARIRNFRKIYEVKGGYEVDHVDGKGITHTNPIPESAVERLYSLCQGETVTADEAAMRLSPYAKDLDLIYHYRWKLKFLAQEIMLILEVQGKVVKYRQRNLFLYEFI